MKQLDKLSFQALRVAALKQPGVELNDTLLEKATDLMTAILLFFKGTLMYLKHDFFYHVWKGILLGPQVYADAKADLDNAINEFDQALFLQVTLKLISTQPAENKDSDGPITAELVKWLQSSHWEVETEFARHCRSRVEGTLNWVFGTQEFKEWRLGTSEMRSSRSLWLNGLPGVGKSTIAAYVVQALKAQNSDACVLYFFCKAGDSTLNTLSQIVRTLGAQLVPLLPTARAHLQKLQEKSFDVTKPDPLFLHQELFRDAIKDASKEIFVILDGLDECSTESQEADLESLLKSLSNLPLKLLVSSRVTAEISNGLSNATKRELTFDDSRDDIQLYVNHCVSKSKNLEKGFKALNINAPEFLSEKSKGNFLWVRLVLDSLKRKAWGRDFQNVIDTLPKNLEGIYEQVLQRLESRESLKLAMMIFRCILHSKRALTVAEMEVMTGLMMEDEVIDIQTFVESECGSLLRQTPTKPASFYIVHETFRSFITTKSSSKENCVEPTPSHLQLLTACLSCLAEPENEAFASIRSYAVGHWLDHLTEVFKDALSVSNEELRSLLSKMHAFWVSETAIREWMRHFTFHSTELYFLGANMVSFRNIVEAFVRSESPRCSGGGGGADSDREDTVAWVSAVLSSDDELVKKVRADFYHAWLNTDWKELETAKWVTRAAMSLDYILEHMPLNLPKVKSRGWQQWFSAGDAPRRDPELLEKVAAEARFDETFPVQLGNYAIALLEVGSDACVECFQEALDDLPGCWHLREGLAEYYQDKGETDKAIASLEKALETDTKEFPSSAFTHAKLVSKKRQDVGDYEGAVEAFREGLKRAANTNAVKYWNAMAEVWESQGNGNKMVDIYQEAVDKYSKAGSVYWEKLAKTYGRGGAREEEWQTWRKAIEKDPENTAKYGEEIRSLARELTSLCIWPPVPVVLEKGAVEDPDNAPEYFKQLGKAYMCQRLWKEALEQFEKYAEKKDNKWIYEDIGHAYLGLGETAKALTAYKAAVSEARPLAKALTLGYVYIIDGDYIRAIRLFKMAITQLASKEDPGRQLIDFGQVDDSNEQCLFQLHLQLSLCYEATGQMEEMKENLEKAVEALKPATTKIDQDKDQNLVYRHYARSWFHIGLVEEKLGRKEDAKTSLERAVFLFEKTSMEGDNEIQTSEAEEAAAALARVSKGEEEEAEPLPDLKESLESMRLQRRLALPYTTDWYCAQTWEPPRRRGFKEWNRVSFVNKFVICQGDRTFVLPWGFGHY